MDSCGSIRPRVCLSAKNRPRIDSPLIREDLLYVGGDNHWVRGPPVETILSGRPRKRPVETPLLKKFLVRRAETYRKKEWLRFLEEQAQRRSQLVQMFVTAGSSSQTQPNMPQTSGKAQVQLAEVQAPVPGRSSAQTQPDMPQTPGKAQVQSPEVQASVPGRSSAQAQPDMPQTSGKAQVQSPEVQASVPGRSSAQAQPDMPQTSRKAQVQSQKVQTYVVASRNCAQQRPEKTPTSYSCARERCSDVVIDIEDVPCRSEVPQNVNKAVRTSTAAMFKIFKKTASSLFNIFRPSFMSH